MNKKNKIKAGIIFGNIMSIFFILQDLLTGNNISTRHILIMIFSSLVGGALGGLIFGWLIGFFVNSKLLTKGTEISLEAGERILFNTGANQVKGAEAVGGQLYLTNKRLVFKSHKFNFQNAKLSISLSDINKVKRYKPLGIADNGLSIDMQNHTEKFIVQEPDEWIKHLTS